MTDVNNNLVSIIVPAYNVEKYISDMIESVLQQTYPYFELIIVDDVSTDRTAEVVQSFSDQRIKLIRHASNKGLGAARNTAIEAASGKWMAVLDADDQWNVNWLERLVEVLYEVGDGYFVADDLLLCFDTPFDLRPWKCGSQICLSAIFRNCKYIDLDLSNFIKLGAPGTKPIIPLDSVKNAGLHYISGCYYGEDFEFECNLFRIGLKLRFILEPLYMYRIRPGSLTSKEDSLEQLFQVYGRLIATRGFSFEEKLLFLEKMRDEMTYGPFSQALKCGNFIEALSIAIDHPSVVLKLLRRLPISVRYRLAAAKMGGYAR